MSNGATAAVEQQKQAEQLDSVFFLRLTIEGRIIRIFAIVVEGHVLSIGWTGHAGFLRSIMRKVVMNGVMFVVSGGCPNNKATPMNWVQVFSSNRSAMAVKFRILSIIYGSEGP